MDCDKSLDLTVDKAGQLTPGYKSWLCQYWSLYLILFTTLCSKNVHIFGRPFVKWFACAIRPLSVLSLCPVCLSVTLVYCGQTVFGPFSAHFYCGQTAGCIKMPLGTEVCLGPGHIVLDGDPAPPLLKGHSSHPPLFSAHVYCGHGHPSQLLLSSCYFCKNSLTASEVTTLWRYRNECIIIINNVQKWLFGFPGVKWQQHTDEEGKSNKLLMSYYLGFHIPKMIKIG